MAVKFDLSSIPKNSNIESAVLEIFKFHNFIGHVGKCKDYGVYRITKKWDENNTNWKSPWSKPGGDFDSSVVGDLYEYMDYNNIWFDWNVDDFVFDMVNGKVENHGFILLVKGGWGLQFSLNQENYFHSNEHAASNLRPKLTVTYSENTAIQSTNLLSENFHIRQNGNGLWVNYSVTDNSTISIIGPKGRIISRSIINKSNSDNTFIIDLFSSGVYFVSIETPNGVLTKKFCFSK